MLGIGGLLPRAKIVGRARKGAGKGAAARAHGLCGPIMGLSDRTFTVVRDTTTTTISDTMPCQATLTGASAKRRPSSR